MKRLLLALRTVKNYRLYTIVNILGLALSLTCVVVIARYLHSELSVNHCYPNHNRIYGLVSQEKNKTNLIANYNYENACFINITADPAVETRTAVILLNNELVKTNRNDFSLKILAVDSLFPSIFTTPTSEGSLNQTLSKKDQIAITQQCAKQLFDEKDPIGQMVLIRNRYYTITSILKPQHSKTSFKYDIIAPFLDYNDWLRIPLQFVRFKENTDINQVNEKYKAIFDTIHPIPRNSFFYPLDKYYNSDELLILDGDLFNKSNPQTIRNLTIIAIIILCIGIFNFINIYTVLMLRRSREIGVKRVFGASKNSILGDIYCENLTLVTLAMVLGWGLVLSSENYITTTFGITVINNQWFNILTTICIVAILPLVTSIYPYFKYNYTKPITSLKEISQTPKSSYIRSILITIQYVMTIVIIVVSIYLVKQLQFMLSTELGYTTENIITADISKTFHPFESKTYSYEKAQIERREREIIYYDFFNDLKNKPLFAEYSYDKSPKDIRLFFALEASVNGGHQTAEFIYHSCSEQYLNMYNLKLKEGRFWNDSIDVPNQYKCIVNEAFTRKFNIENILNAEVQTNQRLWTRVTSQEEALLMQQNPPYEIIGVIEDFQVGHLKNSIPPILIIYNEAPSHEAFGWGFSEPIKIRYKEGCQDEVIRYLEKMSLKLGYTNFNYKFFSDELAELYQEDRKVAIIYSTFAIIAVLIGAMGLFSLSLYDIQQRRREVALRRVNGATIGQILGLLLRKYYILIALALAISLPLSYLTIDWYMQDFAHRAPISWWIFALASLFIVAISLTTVIYQTLKAATQNPAKLMKVE